MKERYAWSLYAAVVVLFLESWTYEESPVVVTMHRAPDRCKITTETFVQNKRVCSY